VSPKNKEQFGDNIAIGMQWCLFADEKELLKIAEGVDIKERMSN